VARTESTNNLKQQVLGLHTLHDTYKRLPPTYGAFPSTNPWGTGQTWGAPAATGSLQYFLLPYIEQKNIYNNTATWSWTSSGTVVKIFTAPLDPTLPGGNLHNGNRGAISYAANAMVFKFADGGSTRIPSGIPDGTSNTIIFAEKFSECGSQQYIWGECSTPSNTPFFATDSGQLNQGNTVTGPTFIGYAWNALPQWNATSVQNCNYLTVQSMSAGGIVVGMGDGSVRIVNSGVSQTSWGFAVHPSDGAVIGNDF